MQNPHQDNFDFFDSPQLQLVLLHKRDSSSSHNSEQQQLPQPAYKQQREETMKKTSKVTKNKKIRTSRNVQKTYHNILKNWLQQQKYSAILPKYNEYYNQRVYFILVLNEILKHTDGQSFLSSYQQLASEVTARKQKDIALLDLQKPNSEQALHLKRVIQEIQFSVLACEEFVQGNLMEALVIVYKRNQERITKKKEFERAIHIFEEVTGRSRQYF